MPPDPPPSSRVPTERRRAKRRVGDRSHLSDTEWREAVERDLQGDARATRGLSKRVAALESGIGGLTEAIEGNAQKNLVGLREKVEEIGVIVQEHTPVSVEDAAYLAILRSQYPIPLMAKLAALIASLEAQQAATGRHWAMVQHLFQYIIGGLISICVLVIGMALQTQHIISVPQLLGLALLVLLTGFVGYAFVSGKAAEFKKGPQP